MSNARAICAAAGWAHAGLLALVAGVLSPASAAAAPQWNAGVVAAGCILGSDSALFEVAAFCGAARGDLLLGRERTRDLGLGPYVALGTAAFDDLRVAGGLSVLLPVIEDFPLVVSAGALATDAGRWGLDSSVFFGLRSYNFYGAYNFAAGGTLGYQRTFGDGAESALSVGVQVDALVLALPFLLGWSALQ